MEEFRALFFLRLRAPIIVLRMSRLKTPFTYVNLQNEPLMARASCTAILLYHVQYDTVELHNSDVIHVTCVIVALYCEEKWGIFASN